jgi:hypothetical protein
MTIFLYRKLINIYIVHVIQLANFIAAIVGAYVSSNLSESYGTVNGVSIPLSFCGGALMIIGARLAGGCTRYLLFIHNLICQLNYMYNVYVN